MTPLISQMDCSCKAVDQSLCMQTAVRILQTCQVRGERTAAGPLHDVLHAVARLQHLLHVLLRGSDRFKRNQQKQCLSNAMPHTVLPCQNSTVTVLTCAIPFFADCLSMPIGLHGGPSFYRFAVSSRWCTHVNVTG